MLRNNGTSRNNHNSIICCSNSNQINNINLSLNILLNSKLSRMNSDNNIRNNSKHNTYSHNKNNKVSNCLKMMGISASNYHNNYNTIDKSILSNFKKQYLIRNNSSNRNDNNNILTSSLSNNNTITIHKNSSTSRNNFPDHLRQRINDIITRRTIGSNMYSLLSPTNAGDRNFLSNEEAFENSSNLKPTKTERQKILKNFLQTKSPKKNLNEDSFFQSDLSKNNNNNNVGTNKQHNVKEKTKFIKDKNIHADLYDDARLIHKSASCQRIQHMLKIYDLPIYGSNNLNNKHKNNVICYKNENIPRKNLFGDTRQTNIFHKIKVLNKFSFNPDYKARKIDHELKKVYAHNNLHIIGGIKGQFEQNIQERENKIKQNENNNNNDIDNNNIECEESVEVDDLL